MRIAEVFAPGDFNGDGVVDAADYIVWRDSLGSTTNLAADGNNNGVVDAGDFDVWKTNFGNHSVRVSTNTAVPEPTTMVMLFTGILTLCSCRRAVSRKVMRP